MLYLPSNAEIGYNAPHAMPWRMVANTQTFTSPYTQSDQTLSLPGARWAVSLTWKNLKRQQAAPLQALLAELGGRAGRLWVPHYLQLKTLDGMTGTVVVNGANQVGRNLNVAGCTAGKRWLRGDYFEVNGELKMITADSTVAGDGTAQLHFSPPLRKVPPNATPVNTTTPGCQMRLVDDAQGWQPMQGDFTDITLDLIEAWA